ncbi:hypothetical protein T06_2572 [Trichinella sp. T6]|nr:hypothetical protein T06_2572 [Trichinella sp. T6]
MQRDNSFTFFALENEKSAVISLVVITGDALFVNRENVKYQCQIFFLFYLELVRVFMFFKL